jgi:5-methylcytosine-specific restriction endonuclease McrA
VRERAKEVYYIKSKKGKDLKRVRFKCEECSKKFSAKNVAVDHIEPVIEIGGVPVRSNGLPDFNVYIDRLFCGIENLQLLCKPCHKKKTAAEAKQRATKRSKTKPTKRKSK